MSSDVESSETKGRQKRDQRRTFVAYVADTPQPMVVREHVGMVVWYPYQSTKSRHNNLLSNE